MAINSGYVEAQCRPGAPPATNVAAINQAIITAQAWQNACVAIGPGTFEIDSSLVCSGFNAGVSIVGVHRGSLNQGSTAGACVLKWVGGAAPMVSVTGTYFSFHGINFQNNGSATHAIQAKGGRLWGDRCGFSLPNLSSPFSVASVEINGVDYDRLSLCEFGAGAGVRVLGSGTTLEIEKFMMDSPLGSGAFVAIRGALDVLTLRGGTVNYNAGGIKTFIDMTSIGANRVSVLNVEGNEFDGNTAAAQLTIANLVNCDNAVFEKNQISTFSDAANVESPITATDSRVTLRNNAGLEGLAQPLVHTLDATSFVYSYESQQSLVNTKGLMTADSQSGNYIPAVILGTNVILQGDKASAMAHAVFGVSLTSPGADYTTNIATVTDSLNKGFMTPGQRFTVDYFNASAGLIDQIVFSSQFSLRGPALAPPPAGKRVAISFFWDGATAHETGRQADANPTWITKTATGTLAFGERRIKADATGGSFSLTLPRADSVESGGRVIIKKVTAPNTVTIAGGAFPIDGSYNQALTAQWASFALESDGTQWLIAGRV